MGIPDIFKINQNKPNQPAELPKPKPELFQQPTEQNRDSKIGENGFMENLFRFKLQNAVTTGAPEPTYEVNTAKKAPPQPNDEIFIGGNQGVERGTEQNVSPAYKDATPKQAAHFLKMGTSNDGERMNLFVAGLDVHKGDAKWTRDFIAEMGSDLTANVLNQIVEPSNYPSGKPEQMHANRDKAFAALETLRQNGNLSQASMNGLVTSMQKKGFSEYAATDGFAKASPELKEMFVKAAIANGDDKLDAAACRVLTTLPSAKQAEILHGLTVNDKGLPDDAKLKNFIKGAMSAQIEVPSLDDKIKHPQAGWNELSHTTFGGVKELLSNSMDRDLNHPPYIEKSPFSADLKEKVFKAVANGLTDEKAFGNFKGDTGFKDLLATDFIRNGKAFLKSEAPDGAYADKDFMRGMTKFFELTLFSTNGGAKRAALMESVVKTMADVGDASKAPPLSQSKYEATHNGWSQKDHVEAMGGLMGMVWEAAANQKTSINADVAERQETAKMFIGMAFAFLPGAGDVLGKVAGEGAKFLDKLPDAAIDFAWGKGKDLLMDGAQKTALAKIQGLNEKDALSNIDNLLEQFTDSVVALNASLPNNEQGELDLRSPFQSAFSFYKNLVHLPG